MVNALPEVETFTETDVDKPWQCIVWDDDVNSTVYVTYVFRTVLKLDVKKAHELMMEVHTKGKAVVYSGERDKAEGLMKKLHVHGLWATIRQGA